MRATAQTTWRARRARRAVDTDSDLNAMGLRQGGHDRECADPREVSAAGHAGKPWQWEQARHAPSAQRRGKARDHRRCRCRSQMAAACATLPFLSLPASAAGPDGTLHRVRSMAMPYFRSTISASRITVRGMHLGRRVLYSSHLHEQAAQADRLSRVRAAHCRHAVESIGASSTPARAITPVSIMRLQASAPAPRALDSRRPTRHRPPREQGRRATGPPHCAPLPLCAHPCLRARIPHDQNVAI